MKKIINMHLLTFFMGFYIIEIKDECPIQKKVIGGCEEHE